MPASNPPATISLRLLSIAISDGAPDRGITIAIWFGAVIAVCGSLVSFLLPASRLLPSCLPAGVAAFTASTRPE